jgi:hypothetical protein
MTGSELYPFQICVMLRLQLSFTLTAYVSSPDIPAGGAFCLTIEHFCRARTWNCASL